MKIVSGNILLVLYNVKANSANLKIFICIKESVKVIFIGGSRNETQAMAII